MNNGNIYLTGYRCTGKTSAGRRLAELTGRTFVDADERFVTRSGLDVSEYVLLNGWKSFRRLETEILREMAEKSGMVVATGGGAVLDPENVRLMKKTGRVVWLRTSPETICRRMSADPATAVMRPGLTSLPLADEVRETLASREPLYRAARDAAIDTEELSVDEVCGRIMEFLEQKGDR